MVLGEVLVGSGCVWVIVSFECSVEAGDSSAWVGVDVGVVLLGGSLLSVPSVLMFLVFSWALVVFGWFGFFWVGLSLLSVGVVDNQSYFFSGC